VFRPCIGDPTGLSEGSDVTLGCGGDLRDVVRVDGRQADLGGAAISRRTRTDSAQA
jgi:hypothetical protein